MDHFQGYTPSKATAEGHVSDGEEGSMDGVVGSFSGLKIHNVSNKRLMEQSTAEGSPVNVNPKRLDLQPTPKLSISNTGQAPPAGFNAGTVAYKATKPSTADNSSDIKEVIVLCSASEGHDTGDHQENALRTALLCGSDGCLRRPALEAHMKFVSSDSIDPAPLADLMRYVSRGWQLIVFVDDIIFIYHVWGRILTTFSIYAYVLVPVYCCVLSRPRVHDYEYLRHLECRGGSTSGATVGAASATSAPPPWLPPPGSLDTDTPLVDASLDAAKRFCGYESMLKFIIPCTALHFFYALPN